MKFIISKVELSQLIGKIQNVVAQKATIPILSNVLVEATDQELIVTATDLTVGMRCFTPAKILEKGSTTLPARRFFQLVRELTASTIEVTVHPNHVTEILAGSSLFKLNGMSKNEFPALPDFKGAIQFKIEQSVLKDLLFRTAYAVSKEDSRYILTGVLLKIVNGTLTMVGTDGKRLARTNLPLEIDPTLKGEYVLPLKAVEELLKLLGEGETAVLYLMTDKLAFEIGHATLITKLLVGEYPDFNRVIPAKSEIALSLHREELISLLRQVSLFTSDASQSVRFTFTPGELILTANSMDVGEGKVSMPVNYDRPRFDIAFNPHFFLDTLRHSRDETVSLELTDAYNPGVITDSTAGLCVLMPMRLNEE